MFDWDDHHAEQFVHRYSDLILRICFTYSVGRADAQDICQNVFLKLLRDKHTFAGEEVCRAYLIRVAINECKDLLKSGWRLRSVPLAAWMEQAAPERVEEDEEVLIAVQKLPLKYREAVLLHYYEGYSAEEIAKIVGSSPVAIRKRLSRARGMLKEKLEEVL